MGALQYYIQAGMVHFFGFRNLPLGLILPKRIRVPFTGSRRLAFPEYGGTPPYLCRHNLWAGSEVMTGMQTDTGKGRKDMHGLR